MTTGVRTPIGALPRTFVAVANGQEVPIATINADASITLHKSLGVDSDDYFLGSSLDRTVPALTVERSFAGEAAFRPWALIVRNRGELAGGSDYQNEAHIALQAGASGDHRRYINYLDYLGDVQWANGVNDSAVWILHDHTNGLHRLSFAADGDSLINAGGDTGVLRVGYHSVDTPPPLSVKFHAGGAADSAEIHSWSALQYVFTTLTTSPSNQVTITDADNSNTRGILYLKGNAGAIDAMFVTSAGRTGLMTASPTAVLDVNSDIIRLRTAKTPASAAATGNQGDLCWDASFIYVCTATNTWERAAIATW